MKRVPATEQGARITGRAVAPLAPATGPVFVLVVGEAPGPRGADKSGFPFFGDAAGVHLYRALRELGAIDLPDRVDEVRWDGLALQHAGLVPVPHGLALSNAYNHCPTDDGMRFRAPTRAELEGVANTKRLHHELALFRHRGLRGIVTLGKVATRTMERVMEGGADEALPVHALPHPSAQGLLSMAADRGRGARMAELKQQWIERCMSAVRAAGYETNAHASSAQRMGRT